MHRKRLAALALIGVPLAVLPTQDASAAAPTYTVSRTVDGDTLDVRAGGRTIRVRLIGIDAPETGSCEARKATNVLSRLAPRGARVTLTAGARDDRDRYGRLLRYVEAGGVDVGKRLVGRGYAVARYDSRDGYGRHTRQKSYIRADRRSPNFRCATPPPPPPPPPPSDDCDPAYPGVCIPPPPPDLDCGDIGYRRFTVRYPDPHNFDSDRDGVGCESG
jgi:endonuclease YncB( thermonuclease family)